MSQLSAPTARRLTRGAAALAIALAFLTACGGNDSAGAQASSPSSSASTPASASSSGDSQTVTATEADFSISLDKSSLKAGTYQIDVVNDGHATHDLVVQKGGKDIGKTDVIAPGKSATLTVTLEPGDYDFFCSIGNHRQMGMETTVSVS